MTGSFTATKDLMNRTYSRVDFDTSEKELIKTFRACYLESYRKDFISVAEGTQCRCNEITEASLRKWSADIKLSVLLSEISGLKHRDISEIIGKPLETVRIWLSWGRKWLVNGTLLNVSF
jgi:DNA-directed RNA polymerase specialized sigma24 family protein